MLSYKSTLCLQKSSGDGRKWCKKHGGEHSSVPIGKVKKLGKSRRYNIEIYAAIGALAAHQTSGADGISHIDPDALHDHCVIM